MRKIVFSAFFFVYGMSAFSMQDLDSMEMQLKTSQGIDRVDVLNKLYAEYHDLDPVRALEYSIMALELANELGYAKGRINSLNNIGIIYKNQGVFEEALDYYIESLRISTEMNYLAARAFTLNNIGTVYSLQGIYDKALIYFIESYEILKSVDAGVKLVDAINNIGKAYMEMGREDLALEYYMEAMDIMVAGKYASDYLNPFNHIGDVYYYRQDYTNALAYYERSYQMEKARENVSGIARSLTNIAGVNLEVGNLKQSAAQLNEALDLASKIISYPLMQVIYEKLSRLYYQQGNIKKAYDQLILYGEVKDFVFNDERSRLTTQMVVAVELQKKEKELKTLKQDLQILSLQVENSRISVILAVMGCIVLLAVGFIFVKVKNEKWSL